MATTVLAVADNAKAGSTLFNSFCSAAQRRRDIALATTDYQALLAGRAPDAGTAAITVMLFFPDSWWNEHVEVYPDERIYGDGTFGREFCEFFDRVDAAIAARYHGKAIGYVNSPKAVQIDRDKKVAKKVLAEAGVPTPQSYEAQRCEDVMKLLEEGELYIKPRYGALGKGISRLGRDRWLTNFGYEGGRIVSKKSDYGWKSRDATGDTEFLARLLERDVLVERAVHGPLINGRRFDMRIYVVYGQTPYLCARSAPADALVTNWAQGGRAESADFLEHIPEASMELARSHAVRAAASFGLNYAGIDVIFSENFKPYVLEGQAFPSPESRFDLMGHLVDCLPVGEN